MTDVYRHNLPAAVYRASLLAELQQVPLSREQKASIVAELEALGPRTADEDRAAFEAATLGPVTVGRAPSVATVAASTVETPAEATLVPDTADTVTTSPENDASKLSGRHVDLPTDGDGR